MTQTPHTPTPWQSLGGPYVFDGNNNCIAITDTDNASNGRMEANAAFIVKAVNAHDDLICALTDCADYFDGCADVDFDSNTFVANKEMWFKMMIDELLAKIGAAS